MANLVTVGIRKSDGSAAYVSSSEPFPITGNVSWVQVETLLSSASLDVSDSSKDLAGNSNAETATITNVDRFSRLILVAKNNSNQTVQLNVRVLARPSIGLSGWLTVLDWSTAEKRLTVGPNEWFRVDIGDRLHFDAYRILVWSQTSGITIGFQLKGVCE